VTDHVVSLQTVKTNSLFGEIYMQKKLIALAIAGLAAAPAFAQSNVTIYGRVDLGMINTGGDSGQVVGQKNTTSFAQGIAAGSRIGFKGNEDLGNGIKAIFELEYGIGVDEPYTTAAANPNGAVASTSSAATWVNRHSYLGLTGGFGTVVAGRLDGVRYGIFNGYDAFGGGTMGNFTQITRQVDRANNAIAYISPNFSGFSFVAAAGTHILGAGATNALTSVAPNLPPVGSRVAGGLTGLNGGGSEFAGNDGDLTLVTLMGKYENGPVSLTLDWEQIKADSVRLVLTAPTAVNNALGSDKITVATIAGSYDFGVVKVSALYDTLHDQLDGVGDLQKKNTWFISAKVPLGKAALKATYGRSDDKLSSNADVSKFGLGVDYAVSKRTSFFMDYGKVKNDSGSGVAINSSANSYGPTGSYGGNIPALQTKGTRGFDIGMAHTF
jgi:predicted porin